MTSAKSERSENAISGTKDAVGEEAEREAGAEVTTPQRLGGNRPQFGRAQTPAEERWT